MYHENEALAYTLGNTIFLSDELLSLSEGIQEQVLTHELFHVFSRSCFDFKQAAYALIGAFAMDRGMEMPISDRFYFMSNPDVDRRCCGVYLQLGGLRQPFLVVNGSVRPYHSEPLFQHLCPSFVLLDREYNIMKDVDGNCNVLTGKDFNELYLDGVGRNFDYCAHPEEVLAETFKVAVLGTTEDLPNPEIIDGLRNLMRA